MCFIQSISVPCIYADAEGGKFFIGVYIDDIILPAHRDKRIQDINSALAVKFDI